MVMPKSAPPSGKTRMRRPAPPRRAFGLSAGLGRERRSSRSAQLYPKWLAGNAVALTHLGKGSIGLISV